MEKIFTPTSIAREKVREELMNKKDSVYKDTDSSYPTGENFHLSAVGPSFKLDLGELTREEFWTIVDIICRRRGVYDGEDW